MHQGTHHLLLLRTLLELAPHFLHQTLAQLTLRLHLRPRLLEKNRT